MKKSIEWHKESIEAMKENLMKRKTMRGGARLFFAFCFLSLSLISFASLARSATNTPIDE